MGIGGLEHPSTPLGSATDQTYHAIGRGRGRGAREKVLTRERGRPAGQERRSLNAVPGSAAEAVPAIRLLRVAWDGDDSDRGVRRCATAAGANECSALQRLPATRESKSSASILPSDRKSSASDRKSSALDFRRGKLYKKNVQKRFLEISIEK